MMMRRAGGLRKRAVRFFFALSFVLGLSMLFCLCVGTEGAVMLLIYHLSHPLLWSRLGLAE
jgi:hypothetical protein